MFNYLSNINTGFNWFNNCSFSNFYNSIGNIFSPISYFSDFSFPSFTSYFDNSSLFQNSLFSFTIPSTSTTQSVAQTNLFSSISTATQSSAQTSSSSSNYFSSLPSLSTVRSKVSSGYTTAKSYVKKGVKKVYNTAAKAYHTVEGIVLNRRGGQYGKPFLDKVKQIASRLKCDYRDLLAIMYSESGIDASVKCKQKDSTASGLIQITDKNARSMGTTAAQLRAMSPIKQLDYVEEYLSRCIKKYGLANKSHISGGDLYAIVFLPARSKNEVLARHGENYYSKNKHLDKNKDGLITKSELAQQVRNKYVSDKSFIA